MQYQQALLYYQQVFSCNFRYYYYSFIFTFSFFPIKIIIYHISIILSNTYSNKLDSKNAMTKVAEGGIPVNNNLACNGHRKENRI